MRKIYLFLILAAILVSPAQAQGISSAADSISKSLARQYGSLTTLQRVRLVRQQLADAVMNGQVRPIPQLLGYLAQTVPDSVPTVQPREAMALLLAAGAFRPLLKRVAADKADQAQRQYRKQPLLPPDALAELADYYIAGHAESLKNRLHGLAPDEGAFVEILLDVLPRGGVSPEIDATIQRFQQQYPNSAYSYVLRGFQVQEQVKARLRVWHERREYEQWEELKEHHTLQSRQGQKWAFLSFPQGKHNYEFTPLRIGCELYYGGLIFSEGLGELLQPRFNIGAGLDIGWNRYTLYLREFFGGAEAKRDFTYLGNTWTSSNKLQYYLFEASVGYRLLDRKSFALSPFAGASVSHFGNPNDDSSKKLDLFLGRPLTAGLSFDLLLGKQEVDLLLKLRGGFRSSIAPLNPAIPGAMFYFSIGLGYRMPSE